MFAHVRNESGSAGHANIPFYHHCTARNPAAGGHGDENLNASEIFLVAMLLIFALPFLVWRLGRTEYFAPLVVVQIITGIVLGPGILGAVFPEYYRFVFNPAIVQSLNGIAWWAVMCFVLLAGI